MLLKCFTQYLNKFGRLSSGHRAGKNQFSFQSQWNAFPFQKKGNAKECSNSCIITLISHASKAILKILQARASAVHKLRTSKCTSWI